MCEGVGVCVRLPVADAVREPVADDDSVAVALSVKDDEGVFEEVSDAVAVRDLVTAGVTVPVVEADAEDVCDDDAVPVALGLPVIDGVSV